MCIRDSYKVRVVKSKDESEWVKVENEMCIRDSDRVLRDFHCSAFPLRGGSGKGEDRKRAA